MDAELIALIVVLVGLLVLLWGLTDSILTPIAAVLGGLLGGGIVEAIRVIF